MGILLQISTDLVRCLRNGGPIGAAYPIVHAHLTRTRRLDVPKSKYSLLFRERETDRSE